MATLLNQLASQFVGDGKRPNLFFVTMKSSNTIAVFKYMEDAIEFAKQSADGDIVEDRLHGQIWTRRYGIEKVVLGRYKK